jgi:outer membrane protein
MYGMIVCMMGVTSVQAREPLTLENAIMQALERNITLNQKKTQVDAAEVQVDKQKADSKPDLTLSTSATARRNTSTDGRPIWLSQDKDSTFFNIKARSTVNLYNGSLDKYSLERSKIELDATNNDYSRVRQSVIFETISRFVNVTLNKQLIKVEERNLQLNKRQLERINSFYKAGNRPINDLYQQRAKASQAQLRLLSAKHDLEVSKLLLSQITGEVGFSDYEIIPPDPPIFEKSDNAPVVEEIFSYAMVNRVDISAQEKSIKAARKKIAEAKAGYKPSVVLALEAGTNYETLLDDSQFSDQILDENPYAALSVSLTLPVLDRKRNHTQVAQAMIELNNEKLKLAELEQQVDLEVRQAVLDYNTTLLQLDVAKKQIEYASQAYDTSKERYEIGSSDLVSLTESMDRLTEASYEQVKARYDHLLANLGIAYYSGELESKLAKWQSASKRNLSDKELENWIHPEGVTTK